MTLVVHEITVSDFIMITNLPTERVRKIIERHGAVVRAGRLTMPSPQGSAS